MTASPVGRQEPLGAKGVGAYAIGSIGTGVFSSVPALLLLFYCTETLDIPAHWAAVIVFVPKAWSILWDPFVGVWSDRMESRFGRRKPFMVLGLLGMLGGFVALFHTPELPSLLSLAWVLTSYFAFSSFYSLFAVPYVALPAELSDGPAMRSTMISLRIAFATLGTLLGVGLAPILIEYWGGGRPGYASMSWALAAICMVAMLGPIVALRGRRQEPPAQPGAIAMQLTLPLRNREFRLLGASYLLQVGATGAYTAMIPYLITRVIGRSEGQIGVALGMILVAASVAAPIWGWIGRVHGEVRTNIWALILYATAIAALGAAALTNQGWPILLLLFALAGVPFAATQVLPFICQAHNAHRASVGGLSGGAGAFAGTWTAIEKLGLAIGPMTAGFALSFIGGNVETGIPLYLAAVSPLMLLLAIIPLTLLHPNKDI